MPLTDSTIQNKILAALPNDEYERVRAGLQVEQWPSGKPLYDSGETISHVYFDCYEIVRRESADFPNAWGARTAHAFSGCHLPDRQPAPALTIVRTQLRTI